MAELPSGTLTFFFSDIEGSTQLLQELGDRWDAVLDEHHRLMREAIGEHGGTEVGTEGDSFFAVFATASAAVAAAVAAQQGLAAAEWPDGRQLRVRMGLHSGTATTRADGGYTGLDIHRAARIMSAAHGGQVLLSDVTLTLGRDSLPEGVAVRAMGEHRLKDLHEPERLHQLVISGLRDDFPALRTLDATPNNLPSQLTSFLGRQRELDELRALLERSRLVTLTGPGGTGKTRLALQVAAAQTERHPDGVWFVALAAISEPELVAPTIARTLGLAEKPGHAPLDQIVEHLRDRRALLLLDNFEQVVAAVPALSRLLADAPQLTLLVTSRAALRLYGEQEYPVPPLALPDLGELPATEQLETNEAIALFVERAAAARPGFRLTEASARTIAEICIRLDGLPLAIELAAARIKLLTPEAILERLGHRLELLGAGPRDLPERQRTLRGAIEWSYDLLDEQDRRLFACLSVFVGGAALEAVEQVCASETDADLLDALSSLVDKSLVRQTEGVGAEPRFSMLETIREFALHRSQASGTHEALRERHALWCVALADALAPQIMGEEQRAVLDRLDEEHDNLRAAISWATEANRPEVALRLCARLWRFWQMRGHLTEGMERTVAAMSLSRATEFPVLYADALEAAGGIAYWRGDMQSGRRWYEEALEARRRIGEPDGIAEALYNLSFAYSYVRGGLADLTDEDLATGRRLNQEAMELFRQTGNTSGEARVLWSLASLDALVGDFEAGLDRMIRSERIFRDARQQFHRAWAQWGIAVMSLGLDRVDDARPPILEALQTFAAADDLSGCDGMLELAALVALRDGQRLRAARLAGAVVKLETTTGIDINPYVRVLFNFDPRSLERDADTAEEFREGARATLDEVVAEALEYLGQP